MPSADSAGTDGTTDYTDCLDCADCPTGAPGRAAGFRRELELDGGDGAQGEDDAGVEGGVRAEERGGRARLVEAASQGQDQRRAVGGEVGRARAEFLGDGDVGDLEAPGVGVYAGAFGDFVDRLQADAEEADLLFALGGLADGADADEVAGVEGVAVVPDHDAGAVEDHAPGARRGVLGVLEELDQEVAGVGVDAAGEEVFGVGLGDRLGGGAEDGDGLAREARAGGVEGGEGRGAGVGGDRAQRGEGGAGAYGEQDSEWARVAVGAGSGGKTRGRTRGCGPIGVHRREPIPRRAASTTVRHRALSGTCAPSLSASGRIASSSASRILAACHARSSSTSARSSATPIGQIGHPGSPGTGIQPRRLRAVQE